MGNLEDTPGRSPGQSPQEKFRLVETDRLIEAVKNSTFLLDPQKVVLERLVRTIQLDPIPANVVPSVINQRARERDAAVSQALRLREENSELRGENQTLRQQAKDFKERLSKIEEEEEERGEVFDGSITEKRIFERMLKVYESFVEDLQLASLDVSCKNEDFDGLELLYLVFDRLLGIDIEQLSPLERREIDWIARDLGYDPDHEVDTSAIDDLLVDLKTALKIARKASLKDDWPPLPAKPTEEGAT